MDLSSNKNLKDSTFFTSQAGAIDGQKNPFLDSCTDSLCKETSDFAKSFPVPNNGSENRGFLEISTNKYGRDCNKRNLEAPPTPGRPIFSFSNGSYSRKSFPSKWDDAEKWVVNGRSFNDSPSHVFLKPFDPTSKMYSRQCSGYKPQPGELFAEKSRVTEEKVSKVFSTFHKGLSHHKSSSEDMINGLSLSTSAHEVVVPKDKLPNPTFGCSEPMQEGFLFGNAVEKSMTNNEMMHEVKHRDIGTEMTPLGSSTTSRCPTPFMSTSPIRHNTPADRSGPLTLSSIDSSNTIDIVQLQECHMAKLHLGKQFDSVATNWSSREEEEDDVSKSLRHFEIDSECRISVSETRACTWEEEEKTKRCLRYQREEAKIQAWVNLQSAKAEAESRKLEVRIQKMRSNLEEKLMKRMAGVHRKAEEWRAAAQFQHSEQIRKVGQQSRKMMNMNNSPHFSVHKSCGCFPCTINNHKYLV